jgi:hypothetical protein
MDTEINEKRNKIISKIMRRRAISFVSILMLCIIVPVLIVYGIRLIYQGQLLGILIIILTIFSAYFIIIRIRDEILKQRVDIMFLWDS